MEIRTITDGANGFDARNRAALKLTKEVVFTFNELKFGFFDRVHNSVEPNKPNNMT